MAGSPASVIVVTEYRLGMHFGLCHGPADAITAISIGDKPVYDGFTANGEIVLNDPNAFGGVEKEGGIRGKVVVMNGADDQVLPFEVAERLGDIPTNLPGFRGILSVFFKGLAGEKPGFYWSANSPYIKNPAFRVRRIPRSFYPEKAALGVNANPAHIVHECLTNKVWGMGGESSAIDIEELTRGADTLYNEGLGLSLMWTGQSTIESFIQEVLDHIEATFFLHPRTGKLTLKLIRQDYDINDVFHVTPDNARVLNFQRKGWGETINEINASWTNPINEKEENVTVHSLGNIAAQGSISSDGRSYYGVRDASLALRLATRDLNASAYPIASCDIAIDRSAWDQVPGGVVKVTWPQHGLVELPMRVGQITYGRPNNPQIVVSLVEDVFALPTTSYVEAPGTDWIDPTNPPEPLAFSKFFNVPYYVIARVVGDAAAEALPYPQQYIAALGAQDENDTIAVELHSERPNSVGEIVYQRITNITLSGHATLSAALPREATSNLAALNNFWGNVGPDVGAILMFGDTDSTMELAVVESVAGATPVLRRGILDTVPRAWPINTPVWLFRTSAAIYDSTAHASSEVVKYKLLPRTSGGLLDIDDAPEVLVTTTDRLHRPIRPANVKINGTLFGPASLSNAGMTGMTISWSNRNRLLETSQILAWTETSIPLESGQTTTVEIRTAGGTLLELVDGLTGESVVTTFDPSSVSSAGIIVRVYSERDGLESLQRFETTIAKT